MKEKLTGNMEQNQSIKEKLCNNLNGKKFDVIWHEYVQYRAEIIADNIEEAESKFKSGDVLNQSKIYIHKNGWNLTLPKDNKHLDLIKKKKSIEMSLTWSEINLALRESLLAGYKEEDKNKPSPREIGKELSRILKQFNNISVMDRSVITTKLFPLFIKIYRG